MKTILTKTYLMLAALFVTTITFATEDVMAPPENDLIENAINLNFGPSPYEEQC